MSTIKSYSVGNGDMFYIEHYSDNFTIIDCCLNDDDTGKMILDEIYALQSKKGITRFISTHPDDDHLRGLERLDKRISILNFYCVQNKVQKDEMTDSFVKYCELRDSNKHFSIKKDCTRRWMNLNSDERRSSGINILWPDPDTENFKEALNDAEDGGSPNNISPIVEYSVQDGVTALWMGDLETEFMEAIEAKLDLPKVDLLFAPHHGRDSGKVPRSWLEKMSPKIIVVGEAPSEHLHYYPEYNTITQNSAGDLVFECEEGEVHVFSSKIYDAAFLADKSRTRSGYTYVGTLELGE